MASISDFRRGGTIMFKDEIYIIVEFQHVNPGKGQTFIKTKLKSIKSGKVIENSFRLSEKIESVRVDKKEMQFLYKDNYYYVFMDTNTFEQLSLSSELITSYEKYIKDSMICIILFYKDTPISLELPAKVEYKVVKSEVFEKGDTATNVTKTVTIETGAVVKVPAFIKEGDLISIDTRTGEYLSRN